MQETAKMRTWSPKRPGYWKWYHRSQENGVLEVFKAISQLVEQHDPPWEVSFRGRPPRITPREYASLCIFMRYYNLTYREIALHAEILVGKSIDHSSIGWAMQRVSPGYLDELVHDLYLDIEFY